MAVARPITGAYVSVAGALAVPWIDDARTAGQADGRRSAASVHPNAFVTIATVLEHRFAGTMSGTMHDTSWSINLEQPKHGETKDLVLDEAMEAIEHTVPGNHVNLVTHSVHGHPSSYLYDRLEAAYGDEIDYEYVEQCGCGGHVVRVEVLEE